MTTFVPRTASIDTVPGPRGLAIFPPSRGITHGGVL